VALGIVHEAFDFDLRVVPWLCAAGLERDVVDILELFRVRVDESSHRLAEHIANVRNVMRRLTHHDA
jgi:hypothetical protein